MIILTKEILENHEQITTIIEKEKHFINTTIKTQNNLKSILLDYMQKLADSTDNVDLQYADIIVSFLNDFKNSLELFKINMDLLKNLLKSIDNIQLHNNTDNLLDVETINKFNEKFYNSNDTILKNTFQIEKVLQSVLKYSRLTFLDSVSTNDVEEKNHQENNTKQILEIPINENLIHPIDTNSIVENTLIISETKGKIFLPYTISLLNNILKDHPEKYSCLEEIIEKEFTLPFDLFKNPAFARFREAFKLVRKKEKNSIKEAFDLGMELLFNYNVHPAIISACKNIDELDIYLDYLENNEIHKFDCFKIVFDIAPTIVKSKKS